MFKAYISLQHSKDTSIVSGCFIEAPKSILNIKHVEEDMRKIKLKNFRIFTLEGINVRFNPRASVQSWITSQIDEKNPSNSLPLYPTKLGM